MIHLAELHGAVQQVRHAETDVEIEDRFLQLLQTVVAGAGPAERAVLGGLVAKVGQLVELRRQRQLDQDRHLAQLFARVEVLEGARVEVRAAVLDHPALRI